MKKKIIVIGCPGSGKSYFSKKLSEQKNIPLYHIDNLYWHPDKTHITRDELRGKLDKIMSEKEWIIDGNYISTMEQRIRQAEVIFYLDFSTEQCLEGIQRRVGIKRDDIPWVQEEIDEEFHDFVKNYKEETKPSVEALLSQYRDKTLIRLHTRDEMNRYLKIMT